MGNTLDPTNYIDPETRGPGLIILTAILMTVGCFVVTVRIYTRLYVTRAFGLDDFLILLAYLLSIVLSILVILGNLLYHSGYHIWDVPPTTYVSHRKNVWWSELIYVFTSCTVKVSVLLFYRRLSTEFSRSFLRATYIGLAANLVYFVGFGGLLFTICSPVNAYWDSFDPYWKYKHPHFFCRPENIVLPVSAALSVVTDLYATIVPLWLITSIQKSPKEKIGLYLVFSLGFLVVLFGIMRAIYVYEALNVSYDFTWVLYDCWIYTQLELNLAIIAACAPALRPMVLQCARLSKTYSTRIPRVMVRPISQRISMHTEKTYVNSVAYPVEDFIESGKRCRDAQENGCIEG